MAIKKITETQAVETIDSSSADVLITQLEGDETPVESLRRVTISKFADAMKQILNLDGNYVSETELTGMLPNIVKSVEPCDGGFNVVYWDDSSIVIPMQSGLAFDTIEFTDGYLHILSNGEDVVEPCFIGGGGGGAVEASKIKITNKMTSRDLTVMSVSETFPISFEWSSEDSDNKEPTGNGTIHIYVNNIKIESQTNVPQGLKSFDVRKHLSDSIANTVKITVEDSYGTTKSFTWNVTVSSLSVSWNLSYIENHNSDSLAIRITPVGSGEKTIHLSVDGEEFSTTTTTATGRAVAVNLPAQSHGCHKVEAWMSAVINGAVINTDKLVHIGVWTEDGVNDVIIAVDTAELNVAQFGTTNIQYMVINPAAETSNVNLSVNGEVVSRLVVGSAPQVWAYRAMSFGSSTLTISSGAVSANIPVVVTSIGYDINEVQGACLKLDPSGHSNAEDGAKTFGYKDADGINHPLTFSNNFDWNNGGFVQDEEGVTALLIKRGTYVTFDRSLFNDNAKLTGKEMKVIFKATNVRNYDTEILTCMNQGVGLKLQAQQAILGSVAERVVVPYCENQKIELDINIESVNENRFAMVWLKGIPSRALVYTSDDSWTQGAPENLKIGSADADVWVYMVKMYPASLTRNEILDNYIADCFNPNEMLARYERNNVVTEDGSISPELIANANPNLRVITIEAERMTEHKKDNVICNVTHWLRSKDESHNFSAIGATMKAQGTSSLAYGAAALNLDIDFKNADWFYNTLDEENNAVKNSITAYAMTENSIPVKYFNLKLNVASSENANNVVLADEYNKYQPFLNPARQADARVRDTVEGNPCVIFFKNSSPNTIQVSSHTVAPGETIFYGCGDMNNSKKNTEVFGQSNEVYDKLCCIEVLNNNSLQCLFQSDDLTEEDFGGDYYFEPRYPDELTPDMKAAFQSMLTWVVSTNPEAATDAQLSPPASYNGVSYSRDTTEYRRAKFRAEVGDYFTVDSLTYHYLFTERHCMTDNRAKNTFISYEWDEAKNGYRWNFCKDYDNDTADGNDNSGGLTFTYGLEDTDSVNDAKVFNASDSVLWCNVRDCLKPELEAMYASRESLGAWDAERIINRFLEHQAVRPEIAYIEDAWAKYIAPYLATGETRYFGMLYGTKEDQRRQFETYQERYIATKYNGSKATADRIEFRASSQIEGWVGVEPCGDMTITPYSDMYIIVKYGNAGTVKLRAKRGIPYSITAPKNSDGTPVSLVDTETYVYLASNITALAGIAGLYTRVATLSSATRLQRLELGSDVAGYVNRRLAQISFGNNPLLEYIDLRGTPNLIQALDLTGLESLEEIYISGSGVTGVTFAEGAPVREAWLSNVQNLTARELKQIVNFRVNGMNISKLWIEDCPAIDSYAIVNSAVGLLRGRITNVNWPEASVDLLLELMTKAGINAEGDDIDKFVLTGSAHVGSLAQHEYDTLVYAFPDLELTFDNIVPSYTVEFKNYDGTVLNTQIVRQGGAAKNPVSARYIEAPTKPSTVETNFTFAGWDKPFDNIISDLVVNASYAESTRYYTVNWWKDQTTLLQTDIVEAHGTSEYNGDDPVPPAPEQLWLGWDGSGYDIVADTNIFARFVSPELPDVRATGYQYIYSDDASDVSGYTLAELLGIIQAERAEDYFSIGDQIKILTQTAPFTDDSIVLELAAFKHYRDVESNKLAQCTFVMAGVMNANHQMNSTQTNATSWKDSSMRAYLQNDIYPYLPIQWRNLMKKVVVRASAGNLSPNIVTTEDFLFLPSIAEYGYGAGDAPYKDEVDPELPANQITFPLYTSDESRKKSGNNGLNQTCVDYWSRSPYLPDVRYFWFVRSIGSCNYSYAYYSYGVSFGFCI